MGKGGYKESIIDLEFDHEGQATFEYVKSLDKRMKAFKRMMLWALATDLLDLVTEKMPKTKKYDRIVKALKIGEVNSRDPAFVVYIDNKAKQVRSVDIPKTLIYVKPKRLQDQQDKGIMVLVENGPWTIDTMPFWPGADEAIVIQRKVDPKVVEKINKMQGKQKSKIELLLRETGRKDGVDKDGKATKKRSQNPKAVPDIAFEMLSLEFGGQGDRAGAMWRRSLLELSPGMTKTLLTRYKKIEQTILDTRYNGWERWQSKSKKITTAQAQTFLGFQKKLGY